MTLTVEVSTMLSIGESSSTMPMSSLSRCSSKSFSSFDDVDDTDAASSESKRSSGGQLSSPGKKVDDSIAIEASTVDTLVFGVVVVIVVNVEKLLLSGLTNGSVVITLATLMVDVLAAVDVATLATVTTFIALGSVAVVFTAAVVIVIVVDGCSA